MIYDLCSIDCGMRLLFISLLFLSSDLFSQDPADSLAKYSYSIIGVMPSLSVVFGSGFFLRNNGFIYFITAKHVLTGCDKGLIPDRFPDEMTIYLTNSTSTILIPTKQIKEKSPCYTSRPYKDYVAVN